MNLNDPASADLQPNAAGTLVRKGKEARLGQSGGQENLARGVDGTDGDEGQYSFREDDSDSLQNTQVYK